MNFNQQVPNNGADQNMAPRQGQGQAQPPQQRNVPMITPQILASLNPQQLQQFKSHPQFHEIMRNYIQRQQEIQSMQQQQQQQPPNSAQVNPVPHMANQGRVSGSKQSPIPQQMSGGNNINVPGGALRGQVPLNTGSIQGIQQGLPQKGISPSQPPQGYTPVIGGHPGQFPPGQHPGAPQGPQAHQNLQRPPQQPQHPQQLQHGQFPPGGVIPPGPPKTNPVGPVNDLATNGVSLPPRDPNLPPHFAPELLNMIPMKLMKSLDEWSEKLKEEGKEVPRDVLLYESIIKKDSEFLSALSKQINGNKALMDRLTKDIAVYNHIKQLRMNAINISSKGHFNNSIWGEGYQGYGNGITNTATKLIVPKPDWTDEQINQIVLANLEKPQNLVPIRLGFDQERDRFKLRDTFLWDLNEQVISVENFAKDLLDDYKFIPKGYYETVVSSIKEQINDYQKKPVKTMGEMRIPIKVDVTINDIQLTDQFEWDILNFEDNDPEEFATTMCEELNLPGEFTTAIAHIIREQTQMYHKTLGLLGYNFDGGPVQEEEIRSHLLPALRLVTPNSQVVDDFFSVLRNPTSVADFTPSLVKLTQLEVERLDKEIERESRRKRRHNANESDHLPSSSSRTTTSRRIALHAGRGGPSLPDLSDLPKTFRTPAPSSILPGGVDLGVPDIYEYTEVYANKTQIRNPNYKPQPLPVRDRVRTRHDPMLGNYFVTIKLRR